MSTSDGNRAADRPLLSDISELAGSTDNDLVSPLPSKQLHHVGIELKTADLESGPVEEHPNRRLQPLGQIFQCLWECPFSLTGSPVFIHAAKLVSTGNNQIGDARVLYRLQLSVLDSGFTLSARPGMTE